VLPKHIDMLLIILVIASNVIFMRYVCNYPLKVCLLFDIRDGWKYLLVTIWGHFRN